MLIVEAGASRERRCPECGRHTLTWKPVRRRGISAILCEDCAAKAVEPVPGDAECSSCGASLGYGDRFCGRCGSRIEYACPTCAEAVDVEDAFCGRCGTRLD